MSAFPDVLVLSCVAVGPAAVDFSGILPRAKISAFASISIAVDFPSAVFCCGPAFAVALSAFIIEFLTVVGVSALIAAPTAVKVPSVTGVSNVSGVPAVICVHVSAVA